MYFMVDSLGGWVGSLFGFLHQTVGTDDRVSTSETRIIHFFVRAAKTSRCAPGADG
jgi:hypothetical protein